MLARTRVAVVVGSVALVGAGFVGLAVGQPWNPRQPLFNEFNLVELRIPQGRYTALVIVNDGDILQDGRSRRFSLREDDREFPILVRPGETLVVPFAAGWEPGAAARLLTNPGPGFVAWGITDRGLVEFRLSSVPEREK